MSEDAAPQRIAVLWSPEARADLRGIEREKKIKPPLTGFRLRCGDYRVSFVHKEKNTIDITGVRNRREAYR